MSTEEFYREEGRVEFANRLIEVIKRYRDDGVKECRLDRAEEHICNRIKYFTERLRDEWDHPEKQYFS